MNTTTRDNPHELAADVRRAVATHLEAHEAASAKELERMLAECIVGLQPEAGGAALRQQLSHLADRGHVHSVKVDGRSRWKLGPGPLAGRIAAARRVLRLDTSVYEPAAATVVRPGAMDFARIPSLLLGQRSRYWGTSR
jgi:hypothetical protein